MIAVSGLDIKTVFPGYGPEVDPLGQPQPRDDGLLPALLRA